MSDSRKRAGARALTINHRQELAHRFAWASLLAVLLLPFLLLGGCGGGSGDGNTAVTGTSQAPSPTGLSAVQQDVAEKLYAGTPRTPPNFYADPPPAGVTGAVQTLHLKNTDTTPGAVSRYELCSDDSAQALAWSEGKTATLANYADLVEQNANAQLFEFVRVPRNDATARLRHRVFRCSFLDRTNTDLANDNGVAGSVNERPLNAALLKQLAEYLWEFTVFNNADHIVLSSNAASPAAAGEIAHVIDMARLVRGATTADCDRIELLRWTHMLNTGSGALRRQLDTLSSFSVRRSNGVVSSCTP